MKKGYFITFEGAEGSGKSTQIKRAALFLKQKARSVLLLREPGGTKVSEAIREIILNKKFKEIRPEAELLLYLAARAQMIREKILPALKQGKIVICDRFEDSTLAYQGFGRKISIKEIERLSVFVRGPLRPQLTFLLDLETREGLKRSGRTDRMERQSLSFHEAVRKGFLTLAKREPKRFVVLNGQESREAIAKKIRERLERTLG